MDSVLVLSPSRGGDGGGVGAKLLLSRPFQDSPGRIPVLNLAPFGTWEAFGVLSGPLTIGVE